MKHSPALASLIDALRTLPGVGPKSAQRMAFHLLHEARSDARTLSQALAQALELVGRCSRCRMLTEGPLCPICANPQRERSVICAVEEPLDVLALEKTGVFKGLYHVLHGALSPVEGIGPRDLRIDELVARVRAGDGAQETEPIHEVILATNPNYEGDYTAAYIAPLLERADLRVTRLARGLPIGGDLEYADEGTLSRALEGRREL